jgi:FkbM family methyltransferase
MKIYNTDYGTIKCYENDFYFVNSLEKGILFDQEMIEKDLFKYIENADTILDIGAHIGNHTIAYAKINPAANIYSFEPQSKLFALLYENIIDNDIKNVTIMNNAVGNEIKQTYMNSSIADGPNADTDITYDCDKLLNLGGLSLCDSSTTNVGEEVSMITIDSLNLQNCDYMKIDVEGAERMVIAGAANTIKKYKPIICYESNFKFVNSNIRLSVEEMLYSYGEYEITELDNYNFLAIPKSYNYGAADTDEQTEL